MKLYSENENYKLYSGSMLDMLEVIEPSTIDSIVTDPPYELNFMGKGWDNSGIAFQPDTWKKCYEVLKPGGYLLAFGGSRTFHRIACAIEDAGFEIRDTIMWLYGSGFPKSMDISKQIDKRDAVEEKKYRNLRFTKWLKSTGITAKEINDITNTNMGSHYLTQNEQPAIPTREMFEKIKKLLRGDIPEWVEDFVNERTVESENFKNRKVIGMRNPHLDGGLRKHTSPGQFLSSGNNRKYVKNTNNGLVEITEPTTDLAKKWQGWGTALKPSFEPIIVARKPFKGSLVDNVIEYGVGGINIDECRVETNDKLSIHSSGNQGIYGGNSFFESKTKAETHTTEAQNLGRFPANTILTYDETDFDEVCGGFPYTKGDNRTSKQTYDKSIWGNAKSVESNCLYADSGSASRYFYCAKASKKDRDEGLDGFEEKNTMCDRNPELASANMPQNRSGNLRKNTHPTVKPTSLMQYLVRLVTPNGGIVLDPFNGSGSTGKAVMYENKERNKNYKYIGIELTEEYLPIAKARIEYVYNLKPKVNPQMTIFDYM